MTRAWILLVAILLAAAPGAWAQSTFASGGLGMPVNPLDARARALGAVGTGLPGWNLNLTNPADIAGFPFRGVTAGLQTQAGTAELNGVRDDLGGARFPLLRIVYPFRRGLVASIGYGAFIDQSWAAFSNRTVRVGDADVGVRDGLESDGALSRVQVGLGYSVTNTLALGLAGGIYTGRLDRTLTREFISGLPLDLDPVSSRVRWHQRAPFASAGMRWDPSAAFRLAGAVTWAGTLSGEADELEGEPLLPNDFEVDLPLQAVVGASALLAPGLSGVVGARWDGWSSAADSFQGARDVWSFGGGVEWESPLASSRTIPLRVGYHHAQLPFPIGGQNLTERFTAFGLTVPFADTNVGPRALVDAAIERGSRDGGGSLEESFWRFNMSLSLFGF